MIEFISNFNALCDREKFDMILFFKVKQILLYLQFIYVDVYTF